MSQSTTKDVRSAVREHYGKIAADFQPGQPANCGCCTTSGDADIVKMGDITTLYDTPEVADLPEAVTDLSLGCGDPLALASLKPGQTVLDLGSGGGIDCFLAAKKVGPTGHVIGVDMTPAMLEKARANRDKIGAENVEFRLGEIEHLPLADASVDVIISNCVINLSPDKAQVFREAFRVLRPGGWLSISDMVTSGPLPEAVKNSLNAWAGCIAGALEVDDYVGAIRAAGFVDVELTPMYLPREVIDAALGELAAGAGAEDAIYRTIFSARVTAHKA